MKITAEAIKGKNLNPGDLFSTADQLYWDNYSPYSIGEKVYIRTEATLPPSQEDEDVYKIIINKDKLDKFQIDL